jgi:predicted RND superfamily exporter protein
MVVYVAITGVFLVFAGKVEVRTSIRDFLPSETKTIEDFDRLFSDFGGNPTLSVVIEAGDVYRPEVLSKINRVLRRLQTEVDVAAIESLATVPVWDDATQSVRPMSTWFDDSAAVKRLVEARPYLMNRLVSRDGKKTALLVTTKGIVAWGDRPSRPKGDDLVFDCRDLACESIYLADLVQRINDLVASEQEDEIRLAHIGSAAVNQQLKSDLPRSMARLLMLTLLIIVALLFLMFRRAGPVLLALWVVGSAVIWSVGALGLTGTTVSSTFQLFPAFLLVVGVGYSVHLLSVLDHAEPGANKRKVVVEGLGHAAAAISAAGITTVFGLWSFSTAAVKPVANLGIFSGLGVLFILVITLMFLPALILVLPSQHRRKVKMRSGAAAWLTTRTRRLVLASCRHPLPTLAAVLIVLVGLAAGIPSLQTRHEPLDWLARDLPMKADIERLNKDINGFLIEILVDGDQAGAFSEPEMLDRLRRLHADLWQVQNGDIKTTSVVSLVSLLDEAGPGTDQQRYRRLRESGLPQLAEYVVADGSSARLEIKFPWSSHLKVNAFADKTVGVANKIMGPGVSVVTGKPILLGQAATGLIDSLKGGYLLGAVLIALVLIFWLKRPRLIAVGLVTNATPAIAVMGLCGWLSLPLDIYLLLVGTIVVSVAVDDTLHLLVGFQEEFEDRGSVTAALDEQLSRVGDGIVYTTVVICSGFAVFVFSEFANLATFGLVVCYGAFVAFLADVILAPALLSLLYRPPLTDSRAGNALDISREG